MCFADEHLELFIAEIDPRAQPPIRSDVVLPIGVELYPVGAVLHLFADCFSDVFRTVDDLYSLGHLQFPRIPSSGYVPVGAIARVETNIRGPGITPRAIAVFTSTSVYIAPSVSRSRMAVKPFMSAVRTAAVARIARYGLLSFSSCSS